MPLQTCTDTESIKPLQACV